MQDDRRTAATAKACEHRLTRLRQGLAQSKLDALLVSNPRDIRYLTGFVGDDSLLLVGAGAGAAVIISDPRYDEFLQPWQGGHTEVVMGLRHRLAESVAAIAKRRRWSRLGVQAEWMTVAARRGVAEACAGRELVDTERLVGKLRMRKDDLEIAAIERAAAIQAAALAAALERLAVGMTEMEFCAVLEYEMKTRGSAVPSFSTMVATGPRSSVIHHMTGSAPIQPGVLLVDWGATMDGYCSDMTRTFGVGRLPARIRDLYGIVLDAQLAAIDAAAPGKTCAEIDAVARDRIEAAGYGDRFGHGLGHGLGLDIHEAPFFNKLSTDVALEPGMVMTVEPGIYLPGVGGVRIEDDVLITEDGCRQLTDFPKDPDAVTLELATARSGR